MTTLSAEKMFKVTVTHLPPVRNSFCILIISSESVNSLHNVNNRLSEVLSDLNLDFSKFSDIKHSLQLSCPEFHPFSDGDPSQQQPNIQIEKCYKLIWINLYFSY